MSTTETLVPRLSCSGTQRHRHEPAEMSLAKSGDEITMRCLVCEIEVTL